MMIFSSMGALSYLCLLAFIGLGKSSEIEKVMPSRYEIESSINRTIEEVERLVRENPSLPKLSRDDIVNILYNITANDMHSLEDQALEAIERTREDYQRALMVVLPYKQGANENLSELYSKSPMVQIVNDEGVDSEIVTAPNPNIYANAQQYENLVENRQQFISAHMRFEESKRAKPSESFNLKKVEVTTTTKRPVNTKPDVEPHKFTFNLGSLDLKPDASHSSVGTKRPIYKGTFSRYRTSTRAPPKLEIIYSTTPKPTTTTEAITETTTTTKKPIHSILSSDQWNYNAPPTTMTATTVYPSDTAWKPIVHTDGHFVPTVENSSDKKEQNKFAVFSMEDLKKIMESTTSTTTKPAPIFVTPAVNQKKVSRPTGFRVTTTVTPPPMRQEVEHLLKSIGLQPMKPSKENELKLNTNNIASQLNAYLDDNNQESKKESVKTTPTPAQDNSFSAPASEIKDGVKNLSPDIQLLFQQFGLQASGKQNIITTTTTTTTTAKPVTAPARVNSYTQFKPLPTSQVRDKDFRNFLARFGLGVGETRNQKAMQPATKRPSLIEAVPDNMKKILENIGLIRKAPKIEQQRVEIPRQSARVMVRTTTTPPPTTLPIEHVFKPEEIDMTDGAQNEKIKSLLNTVRMVQEGKAGVQDVQKIAHELIQSTKSLENGPDPLKLEEILSNYRNSLKNEVKRQQEQTTTVASTTASGEMDATTFSSIASTDYSGSPSEISESSASADTKLNDQSSSSTDQKASKPNFFDTFDVNDYLSKVNNDASSTTPSPASGSTSKPNFFDTFNVDDYLKMNKSEDTTKDEKPNLSDLEESFGGSTAEPDPVLPTRPKTGLYFLVDWNTFLQVGEEGKDQVNLRFAPKIGDKSRFISVKVP